MSLEQGIHRIGRIISVIAGIVFGVFPGTMFALSGSIILGIFIALIGFIVIWLIVRLIVAGIIWIIKGFKEK